MRHARLNTLQHSWVTDYVGARWVLILSALEQGEAYGLEIVKRVEAAGSGELKLKDGSLYPALYRLEQAGLAEGQREGEGLGRRGARRRLDRLTSKGRRQLAQGRQDWADFVAIMNGVLGTPA
jgi:DNA-binding PadR family transcriptional regulator